MLNRLFLYIWRSFLFTSSVVWAGKITIQQAYNEAPGKPKSCEAVYYGLFTDGTQEKSSFEFDDVNTLIGKDSDPTYSLGTLKSKALATAKKVQEIYFKNIFHSPNLNQYGAITGEWKERLQSTRIGFYGSNEDMGPIQELFAEEDPYGAFLAKEKGPLLAPKREIAMKAVDFLSFDVDGKPIYKGRPQKPSIMGLGEKLIRNVRSQAALAFRLGHEFSHTMEWAPDSLIDCLGKENSIGARRDPDRILDLSIPTAPEAPAPVRPYPPGYFWMLPPSAQPHMDFNSGKGTELIRPTNELIAKGDFAGAHKLIAESKNLPPQINEAVADWYGIKVATQFIKDNYTGAGAQRNAALAILFSMPPNLYDPDSANIMNLVGSKKTNEKRVFDILLANKEFRQLIGCEFQRTPPPRECP